MQFVVVHRFVVFEVVLPTQLSLVTALREKFPGESVIYSYVA